MQNDLIESVKKKSNDCLCVVTLTITTATDDAQVSCHKGTDVSVNAEAPVPGTLVSTDANAGVGMGKEISKAIKLHKGNDRTVLEEHEGNRLLSWIHFDSKKKKLLTITSV